MIKEPTKVKKTDKKESFMKDLLSYGRTAAFSFLFALVFTLVLSFQARSEMIKNLYIAKNQKHIIEQQLAKQITEQSNLTESLATKPYSVCMQVGDLYEAAANFEKAEYAYKLATERAKSGNYKPYYKLVTVLATQEKFSEAEDIINSIYDISNKDLIKFKTRSYIVIGDKYYSIGKFLKAASSYERANYYYTRFKKQDKVVADSIKNRIINSYVKAADIIVKNGYNTDAVRFLKKAADLDPNNFSIQYKLAVIYADLDPLKSVEYFEPLLEKMPQDIDYETYNRVLMKAANIADLQGDSIKAKYYRYRIHTIDLFINNKVVYKNDFDVFLNSLNVKKVLFSYKIKLSLKLRNDSAYDIYKMKADVVLKQGEKIKEVVTLDIVNKNAPLYSNGSETKPYDIVIGKNIFTKRELENYVIEIYLYKDKKYKTFIKSYSIPIKNFKEKDVIQDYLE